MTILRRAWRRLRASRRSGRGTGRDARGVVYDGVLDAADWEDE